MGLLGHGCNVKYKHIPNLVYLLPNSNGMFEPIGHANTDYMKYCYTEY